MSYKKWLFLMVIGSEFYVGVVAPQEMQQTAHTVLNLASAGDASDISDGCDS